MLHAPAQQMFCAQMLLAQSPFAVQLAPLGRLTQAVPMQTLGVTQSASAVHDIRHAPVPHWYAPHVDVVAAWQVPIPLQVRADVSVDPVHVAAAHCVPAAYRRHAPPPSQVPSSPQVAAPPSVHWPSGSCPLGTLLHEPTVPAIAHERQVPVQVVAQQTPCAQIPMLHSAFPPQAAPIGLRPQLLPLQVLGDAQSALVVQVVRQAPLPHANGAQPDESTVWQVPVPLHVRAGVNVVPEQVAAMQVVPAAYRRQAPVPLHMPSLLQLEAPRSAHWFRGSWPFGTLVQAPTVPASAHDWQPPQAELQQTPWAQKPDWHSPPAAQVAPSVFLIQLPPMQLKGATQSAWVVQVVRHAPVPQAYGSHIDVVAAWQLPLPLHDRVDVSVEPVQLAVPHVVPAA